MKIKDQVCNVDLAKRLKQLGVEQESLFWWVDIIDGYDHSGREEWWIEPTYKGYKKYLSAFTVAELGKKLPEGYWSGKFNKSKFVCWEYLADDTYAKTEADARAKMLIYLLENKLISPN
jgi:hypothetical protein